MCKNSDHPLDFDYIPSAMAHGPGIGLGLALAQPQRHVIVLNGDGCMLMSLGSLVTITESRTENLTLVVMNNGVYEVIGGQRIPNGEQLDYPAMAKASGFPSAVRFDDLAQWRDGIEETFTLPGPRFIELRVEPLLNREPPKFQHSIPHRIERLRKALGRVEHDS